MKAESTSVLAGPDDDLNACQPSDLATRRQTAKRSPVRAWFVQLFTRVDAQRVLERQRFNALRLAVEHAAAAEVHEALAAMYRRQATRTGRELGDVA